MARRINSTPKRWLPDAGRIRRAGTDFYDVAGKR